LDISIENDEPVESGTVSDHTVKEELKNEIKTEESGETHVSADKMRCCINE
jgi:hypothetical protein